MRPLFLVALALLSQVAPDAKIPHLKDETPIIRIKTDPVKYLDEDLIICGGIGLDDYFNFAYSTNQTTHHSIRFREAGTQGVPNGRTAKPIRFPASISARAGAHLVESGLDMNAEIAGTIWHFSSHDIGEDDKPFYFNLYWCSITRSCHDRSFTHLIDH